MIINNKFEVSVSSDNIAILQGWDLTQVIIKQFKEMQHGKINHSELERAKTQLKSTLLMNLEYRTIVLEDIGRSEFRLYLISDII